MNSPLDYYQILGISRDALPADIKQAYRRHATVCHPDHGGSHEAMFLINEAYEVLRNAESRRKYDQWLTQQGNQSAELSSMVARARNAAGQYPRNWKDFEQWMNAIREDFSNAKYGETTYHGTKFVTVKNSVSGWVFIVVGIVAGGILGLILFAFVYSFLPVKNALFLKVAIIGCAALGAYAGKWIHENIGTSLKSQQNPGSSPSTNTPPIPSMRTPPPVPQSRRPPPIPTHDPEPIMKIKITCPHCEQRIEAPVDVIGTVVTCPTCNKDFHVGKRTPQPPPIPRQPPPIP